MDANYYKEFVLLSEIKNFTETAEQLCLTEATLSRHIKAMENDLGVTLFDRTTRTFKLSEYGEIFSEYAKKIATLQQDYTEELKLAKQRNRNTLTIATGYFIFDLIAKFRVYDDSIDIQMIDKISYPNQIPNMLLKNECELAFLIDGIFSDERITSIPFATDKYVAVLPLTHPLAKKKKISLEQLANEPFITLKANTYGNISLKALCQQAGFNPHIIFTADVGSAIASFVKQGAGVSILQKKTLNKMFTNGVSIVDIQPEQLINISLCYKKNTKLSASAKSFIQFATEIWPTLQTE